jgi:hypothetical protein
VVSAVVDSVLDCLAACHYRDEVLGRDLT